MVSKPYKVGVVGYGLSAKIFHIPFITAVKYFQLYAIVQRTPKPDDDAGKDWPDVKVYRSAEELCDDSEVDLVVVTTAPMSHFEMCSLAVGKGKNVIVEKPFTPTSKEAYELAKMAKEKEVLLTVYQNRRYDQDFLTLKKILNDGTLGRVVEFETHFDRHRPEKPQDGKLRWKDKKQPGTGAVYDLGTHLIDQVVDLFGLPESVTAWIGSQRVGSGGASDVEDSCTVILGYKRQEDGEGEDVLGLLVTVKAAVVSCEDRQLRYWVRGEKGSWKKWDLDVQEDQLKEGLRPGDGGYGHEKAPGVLTLVGDRGKIEAKEVAGVEPETYCQFYRQVAKALGGDTAAAPVTAERAADIIRLIELAKESSRLGRTLTM